ncbi:Vitamin B12 import ATP-binding protein BtuD [Paraburkholderia domus]|uniref:Vitamin B12 import ATP-binding protein BtuD n=2 Tax=Paraburkholderia domus TaxID=2793075 RepID=A0A9N8N3N3_9BURK|nr:Vitamin B12 import ATP-binding protein BtuD [Paraburkholderia domus]
MPTVVAADACRHARRQRLCVPIEEQGTSEIRGPVIDDTPLMQINGVGSFSDTMVTHVRNAKRCPLARKRQRRIRGLIRRGQRPWVPEMNEQAKHEAIVATGLTKWFGDGSTRTTAVNSVDFVAHFGEILFIVGPSGSGKTTLLSMISGILRPNAGTVSVNGDDIWTLNDDQLADFRLNTIGFVFQDYHLFPRLTSAENVAIPLILKHRDWKESITAAGKYLEVVGLKNRGEILPVKLSGGEQQRVAIARAIVGGPQILILDEPTASLDGDTGRMIIAFVKEKILDQNRCIVIVTHDARINEYADRIIHMEDGRITGLDKGTE